MITNLSESVFCITAEDDKLDLFESRYPIPDGITYNSYVIVDEKVAVLDAVDIAVTEEWLEDLDDVLEGRSVDYLIVHHMEPDHGASIPAFLKRHPEATIVAGDMAIRMVGQFFGEDYLKNTKTVQEGDILELGKHSLMFMAAPLVHWPEVMMSFETSEGLFFSADAFGRFGPADPDYDWASGARRYYFNIVGKFGSSAKTVLDKAADLDIEMICPLHGPVLYEELDYYISLYDKWSTYVPETEGVFIAYTSVYGNTEKAAFLLADILKEKGVEVKISDLARTNVSYSLENAFRYDRLVVATTTYEGGVFPEAEFFVDEILSKKYKNRKVGLIDNGSWVAVAAKKLKKKFEEAEGVEVLAPVVSVKSAMTDANEEAIRKLADALTEQ
jgi:flavorubredoxin